MITFIPWKDGRTVLCLLQYTDDYPAGALKVTKDSLAQVVDMYANSRGWSWLQLQFQEKTLRRPGRKDPAR